MFGRFRVVLILLIVLGFGLAGCKKKEESAQTVNNIKGRLEKQKELEEMKDRDLKKPKIP